jgi:hypothetical protein
MEEGRQKSKRLSYTAKFEREVIRCAEDKGNLKAAAIFGVDENNVRLWRKHKWSPKLKALRKQVNAFKHRVKRCKNFDLKEISNARFQALKSVYIAELIRAKQDSWRKFCAENTKHTPWKLYKFCKPGFSRTPVPTSLTLLDGSATTSEVEAANGLLHKFFPDDDTAQDNDYQTDIRAQTANIEPPNSHPEPLFSKHEVDDIIRNLDGKKCPGPDGIDGAIVKQLRACRLSG